MRQLVLILTAGLLLLALYTFQRSGRPDSNLINLAVRATVYALPSPTVQVVEVTRVVEITRVVEVVRYVEVTATPVPPSATPTALPTPTPVAAVAPTPDVALAAEVAAAPRQESPLADGCPASSNRQFTSVPTLGPQLSHPDSQHGDLNLALRGYAPIDAQLSLVDINGPTDGDAPQLPGVLGRGASITSAFQGRDWNWACGERGCRGDLLGNVEVSLIGLATSPDESISVPARGAEVYGGGYVALVLYAEPSRLTLGYTRDDSVAHGYVVHLEDLCVDPNLLGLYQANNSAGRGSLPAVRNGEVIGVARYNQVIVAVRDRGSFTDPRSRKDWWRGH